MGVWQSVGRIHIQNTMDAQIVYSSLEDYRDKLQHDLRTRYDGHEGFSKEDDDFLNDAIDRTHIMLRNLKDAHPLIVTKG